MQINGLGQISSTTVKTRKLRSGDGSFIDVLEEEQDAGGAASVATPLPMAAATSLLALQELPDAAQGRSRGLMRAQDMLEGLEDIRRGLLAGVVSGPALQSLKVMARQQRETIDDPRLLGLLDDIELRVEVELAKLEMSRG